MLFTEVPTHYYDDVLFTKRREGRISCQLVVIMHLHHHIILSSCTNNTIVFIRKSCDKISSLGVSHVMRSINVRYLLTYLLRCKMQFQKTTFVIILWFETTAVATDHFV